MTNLEVQDFSRPCWPRFVVVDVDTSTIVSQVFPDAESAEDEADRLRMAG